MDSFIIVPCFQTYKGENKPVPVKKKTDKPAEATDNGIVIPVPPPPADKKQNDQQMNAYKKQADDADKRAKAAEQRATSSENTVVRNSFSVAGFNHFAPCNAYNSTL